jgi:TRAP-type C4-dicarboxylate transport system substrate-binding protein
MPSRTTTLQTSLRPAAPTALAALLTLGGFALFAAPAAQAQTVTVKMATLVPEGSQWHTILKEMAESWKTASNGKVVLRLYAGGVAGDDPDVVRKMRLGTLNGGVLTSAGVGEIDKSVYALSVPMMFQSYDEVYAVLDKMRPTLDQKLADKGFVTLGWADGGWVHYFAQQPVATPDDLRKLKLFSWAGDTAAIELLKAAKFNPIPLPSTELSTALQTGLVQAFGAPPQVTVIAQYYNHAKFMTDLDWQLLLGAIVVQKDTWDKIPADVQPKLREAAETAARKLREAMRAGAKSDVEAMQQRGLTVVPVNPQQRAQWEKLVADLTPKVRGPIVPEDAFDLALRLRDEVRKGAR